MKKAFWAVVILLFFSPSNSLLANGGRNGPCGAGSCGCARCADSDVPGAPGGPGDIPVEEVDVGNTTVLNQGNGTPPGGPDGNQDSQNDNSGTDPVNTFTGEPWITVSDFQYNRIGFPLKFERYYRRGVSLPSGSLGNNWIHNYEMVIFYPSILGSAFSENVATLVMPHRVWTLFTDDGHSFRAPPGSFLKIERLSLSDFKVTNKFGIMFFFKKFNEGYSNMFRLIRMTDKNGNEVSVKYEGATIYWEKRLEGYFTPAEHGRKARRGKVFFNIVKRGLRIKSVIGNNGLWKIDFEYQDTPLPSNASGGFIYRNDNWHRLLAVSNNVGDRIVFNDVPVPPPNPGPFFVDPPVTHVSRFPSGLHADYKYAQSIRGTFLLEITDFSVGPGTRRVSFKRSNLSSDPNVFIPGPVTAIVNGRGQEVFRYEYFRNPDNPQSRTTTIIGPHGHRQVDVYEGGKWVKKEFLLDGQTFVEEYEWNEDHLMTKKKDGRGNAWKMEYDSLGNLIRREDPEGFVESFEFNQFSRLIRSVDKNGKVRNFTYESNGVNLSKIEEPLGKVTRFRYFPDGGPKAGLIREFEDANGHVTKFDYDANGNLALVQEPPVTVEVDGQATVQEGALTRFIFDSRSRLTSRTDALGQVTSYVWNDANQLEDVHFPDGTNIHYTYDSENNRESARDANDVLTRFQYDADANLTDVFEAFGTDDESHTRYEYDPLNNRTAIVDGEENRTEFRFNEQFLVRSLTDAIGKGVTFSYDAALNLKNRDDGRVLTRYDYFKNNRLRSISFSDGTPTISFDYDGNGNRLFMSDAEGTKTYQYDDLNRLIRVTNSATGMILNYAYDLVGNRLRLENNLAGTITYRYYENNLLKSVTDRDGLKTTYVYNPLKNVEEVHYPNGVLSDLGYLPLNHRLQFVRNQVKRSGEILSRYEYQYDAVGNRTQMQDLTGLTAYGYDKLYRLTRAEYPAPRGVESFEYDRVGNRKKRTLTVPGKTPEVTQASYNAGNELVNFGGEAVEHDASGNRTRKGDVLYEWDGRNRLIRVKDPGKGVTVAYTYNGDNLRVRKVNETTGAVTRYVYDGLAVLLELDETGQVKRRYNPGISVVDDAGNKFFYHYDGLGSVVNLTDTQGNLVQSYTYDAFGRSQVRKADGNAYRFVGGFGVYDDSEVGLQYMWHRWYEPKAGRFVSRDPLGFEAGINMYVYGDSVGKPYLPETNRYNYTQNNPITRIDPLGLWYIDINVSLGYWGGGTGGIIIGSEGIYTYGGSGLVSPPGGIAVTASPSDPSPGWNVGFQAGYWAGFQYGYSFRDKDTFWEVGFVTPGFSGTVYYVSEPWKWPWNRAEKKVRK